MLCTIGIAVDKATSHVLAALMVVCGAMKRSVKDGAFSFAKAMVGSANELLYGLDLPPKSIAARGRIYSRSIKPVARSDLVAIE